MSEFEMAAAASLDAYPVAAETITEAGQGWFGTVMAGKAARLAVGAWAAAVNGDDALLASIADPNAAHWLLNPVRARRRSWKCRDPAPTREEAEKLVWPAISAQTERVLGEGDWRPSLGSLRMTRLLGPPPTGDDG